MLEAVAKRQSESTNPEANPEPYIAVWCPGQE